MKTIYKLLGLSGILCGSFLSGASVESSVTQMDTAGNSCDVETASFQAGESLTYKVYYNAGPMWITAGEMYFKLQNENYNGKDVYHGIAEAVTYKSFDWVFKVRDKMETWMDVNTLQSTKFTRDVYEGGYTFYRSYDWNRSTNVIKSYYKNRKSGIERTTTMKDVNPCAVDLLSSFYWARSIDFSKYKPGDKIALSLAVDDEEYNLYIRYEGKEEYKTKLGTFNCFKVKPLLVEGAVFHSGEGMTIWVTDDENRIPVRIESKVLVGRITADLKSYAGLKHPFASKVK
ncbi:MAG: DUF3108 domain-containing protein [Chitinophagales bacterium]|nr:DUF3108 domain-containing protein [Chitinophagales bacterium]